MLAEIIRREEATGELYDFVLMHDPEDVIHPLELKLVNWHFETFDKLQFILNIEIGNMTLVERPTRVITLVSAVRSALGYATSASSVTYRCVSRSSSVRMFSTRSV